MALTTRLDRIVTLREQEADKRLKLSTEAGKSAKASEDALRVARDLTRVDSRRSGAAFEWDVIELAHRQALVAVKTAEQRAKMAQQEAERARQAHLAAHGQAQAIKRVADSRRDELQKEMDLSENRKIDDLTSMLFSHRARSA